MNGHHVPARAWTLAKLAAAHGWEVRIDPWPLSCDVDFHRDEEWVGIGWLTADGKARLGHVSYRASVGAEVDILLRDVPAILTGGQS